MKQNYVWNVSSFSQHTLHETEMLWHECVLQKWLANVRRFSYLVMRVLVEQGGCDSGSVVRPGICASLCLGLLTLVLGRGYDSCQAFTLDPLCLVLLYWDRLWFLSSMHSWTFYTLWTSFVFVMLLLIRGFDSILFHNLNYFFLMQQFRFTATLSSVFLTKQATSPTQQQNASRRRLYCLL